jgi:D-arginine dehydrogenase
MVILFDPPNDIKIDTWPLVIDADENWYFKPDAGKILASPADETPVVGVTSDTEGFFWLAGQDGYGIETSPAMGVAIASLIVNGNFPVYFLEAGVLVADFTPRRFT